jgi:2-polyprenyl-3-methyl-5-hydroxy-6-metoxy-1,4-benzoquinol methylase
MNGLTTTARSATSSAGATAGLLTEDSLSKQFHTLTSKVDRYHFWHVVRNEHIFARLKRACPDFRSSSFLEIGCGGGNVLGYLHQRGIINATGWDIDPFALTIARARFPQASFEQIDVLKDCADYVKQFDIIGSFDCLEHIEEDSSCLMRVRELLNDRGSLIISVPALPQLWSSIDEVSGHYRRYTRQQITALLQQCGFKNIHAQYIMAPLVPPLILFRKDNPKMSLVEKEQKYLNELTHRSHLINVLGKLALRTERLVMGSFDLGFGASLLCTANKRI